MGNKTGIAWTGKYGKTFNAWEGCQEVADECDRCYARVLTQRFHPDLHLWGPGSDRLEHVEAYWQQLARWNKTAYKHKILGDETYVFCGSMMDVCDLHPTAQRLRPRLIQSIEETPSLTYQFLSKRPGLYNTLFWQQWPSHVWAGTSAGSPKSADIMIPKLIQVDAPIRFVSVEPFIQDFDITPYLSELDWVIIGGESGVDARPMDRYWAERMIDACQQADVAVFMKQMGSNYSYTHGRGHEHGTDMQEWPEALRVQQFPTGPRANRRTPYSVKEKRGVAL